MNTAAPAPEAAPEGKGRRFLRERFGTPAAVYGLILFTVLIAGASDEHSSISEVFVISVSSLFVFFLSHVFAHTLGEHGALGFRRAAAEAVHHSSGMLYASIPPAVVLGVGALTGADAESAANYASMVAVLVLGVLGYFAYERRGVTVATRIVGALGTAFLGLLIIILDYAVH